MPIDELIQVLSEMDAQERFRLAEELVKYSPKVAEDLSFQISACEQDKFYSKEIYEHCDIR
jgi:hypothetical protein